MSSARAIASSWLTMWAARWLEQRDLLQRLLQRLRVALARVDLALRQLGLGAQAGQRRLQLVRGIGEEVLLGRDRLVEPGRAGR